MHKKVKNINLLFSIFSHATVCNDAAGKLQVDKTMCELACKLTVGCSWNPAVQKR